MSKIAPPTDNTISTSIFHINFANCNDRIKAIPLMSSHSYLLFPSCLLRSDGTNFKYC